MTIPKEMESQIDSYLSKRDSQFEAVQKLAIHDTVALSLGTIEAKLLSEQTKAIRLELDKLLAEKRAQQRSTINYFVGLVGISAIAIVGFLWKEVNETAQSAATAAIEEPLQTVREAEIALEAANEEFDSIRAQITNTQDSALSVQKQVVEMLREVDQALGAIKSAEGGVALANDLSRIYERLERMEYARRSQIASEGFGPTIEEQFFGEAVQEEDQNKDYD